MKKISFVLVVMGLVFSSGPVLAKDGFYLGMDLGIAVSPGINTDNSDNDVGTTCDGFINNNGSGGHLVTPKAGECNPPPSAWSNGFDGGTGILAGASLGYRMGSFRIEGEYFYRGTTHDSSDIAAAPSDDVTQAKAAQELAFIEGGLDDVLSHNFFANLYYDYRSDSKFTPYLGVGVGFAQVSMDFYNRWARNHDPSQISTFTTDENGDALDLQSLPQQERENRLLLNRNVAGTTSIARAKLSDTLFGYQVIAGVDYQVSEPVSIGLKFRWADFAEFEDGGEWNQLRSHDSARSPGGTRVQYKVMTDDIQFWGVSLNMKYQF